MHDFPDPNVSKVVSYGIYDIGENQGWVNVGMSADTAEFAVQSIREWWQHTDKPRYRKSRRLLICADSGGSNGYRLQLWKRELQHFATKEKLTITVCHSPPGTSKWNKIEHRPVSLISANWNDRQSDCRDHDEGRLDHQGAFGSQNVQTRDQSSKEGSASSQSRAP